MLGLLQKYPSPALMKTAGVTQLDNQLIKLAPRMGRRLATEITQALNQQTVVVVGTNAASIVLPRLAEQLAALRQQRADIAIEVERLVEAHPLYSVLTSIPGVGVRTTARLLTEVSGKDFATAAHLAATPASHPSRDDRALQSEESTPQDSATKYRNAPYFSPHLQPFETQPHAPTTTEKSPKRNATTKHSSP